MKPKSTKTKRRVQQGEPALWHTLLALVGSSFYFGGRYEK